MNAVIPNARGRRSLVAVVLLALAPALILPVAQSAARCPYATTWESLKTCPVPPWFDDIPFFYADPKSPQVAKYQEACLRLICDYLNVARGWGKEVYVNNKGRHLNWPEVSKNGNLLSNYAISLHRPTEPLVLTTVQGLRVDKITLLGRADELTWTRTEARLRVGPPANIPGAHAWVFKIATEERHTPPRDP
jgi:hypothetical protein